MIVNYKKLTKTAKEPTRGSEYSAGFDLYADIEEDIVIRPHETIKVSTGLAFELPENTFGAIFARSGIATKQGLRPSNCVGVCDADYRGEYIVALHNDTSIPQIIKPQERIAQMVLLPYISMEFNEVEMLSETVRGNGGFGSSGTR